MANIVPTKYTHRVKTLEAVELSEQNFDAVRAWVDSSGTGFVPWVGHDASGRVAMSVDTFVYDGEQSGEVNAAIGDYVVRYPSGRWFAYNPDMFNLLFVATVSDGALT